MKQKDDSLPSAQSFLQREGAYLQKHGFRVGAREQGVDAEQVITRFAGDGVALGEGRPSSFAERGQITAVAEVVGSGIELVPMGVGATEG